LNVAKLAARFFRHRTPTAIATAAPSADPVAEMIPDDSVAAYVGGGTAELFRMVGEQNVSRMRSLAGLRPDERILEVGCGIGRIAIALTQYVEGGSYVGFDIVPHGIDWCREKITPRYPDFTFFVADIANGLYNPNGTTSAAKYRFPFDDRAFDFVFLTSVFTHMPRPEVEHYIAEIARVLDRGGRCYCTAFVISAEARRHLDAGSSGRKFSDTGNGYWVEDAQNPMGAVGYDEAILREMFRREGLEVTAFAPDAWWTNPYAQDVLVLVKP